MATTRTETLTVGTRRLLTPLAWLLALLALSLAGPGTALARGPEDSGGHGGGSGSSGSSGHGGGDHADRAEVRVSGMCGRGASSRLTLKARDGEIEAEFEISQHHSGSHWRVVVVQERRIVWRGRERTSRLHRSLSVERRLDDLPGSDEVMARAVGPRGVTCQASAVLPGS